MKQNKNPYKMFKPLINIYSYTLVAITVLSNHYNQYWWQYVFTLLFFLFGLFVSTLGSEAYEYNNKNL